MAVKKYSKVKFTWTKELFFIIGGLLLLGLGVGLLNIKTKSEKFYSEWYGAGATSLTTEHPYVETKLEKLYKEIEKGELVYVFYGTSSDSTAQSFIASVETQAEAAKVEKIYVLDSAFASEKDRTEDVEFDDELKAIETKLGLSNYVDPLQTNVEDKFEASLDNTPSLWVYQNGVLVYVINTQLVELSSSNYTASLYRAFAFAYEAK